MSNKVFSWVLVGLRVFIVFAVLLAVVTEAQDACWFDVGGSVNGITVPEPNVSSCNDVVSVHLSCGVVELQAWQTGVYDLEAEDLDTGSYAQHTSRIESGKSATYTFSPLMDVLFVWFGGRIVSVIDLVDTCDNPEYVSDGRVTLPTQEYALYGHSDYLQIYAPDGELIAQITDVTELPYCPTTDLCIYQLSTGEYQINITEDDGKLIEIISADLLFNETEVRIHD